MSQPTLAKLAPNIAAALDAGNPLLAAALAEGARIILPGEPNPTPELLHHGILELSSVDQARLRDADKDFKRKLGAYRIQLGGDALDDVKEDRVDARAFARATGMLFHNRLAIGLLVITAVMDLSVMQVVLHHDGTFDNFVAGTIGSVLSVWHGALLLMLGFYYGTTFKSNQPAVPDSYDGPRRRSTDQK